MEKKQIRFINALSETLFFIEDGGTQRYACRYIDECHTWTGDRVCHIREFAEIMEQNVRVCRPAKKEDNDA